MTEQPTERPTFWKSDIKTRLDSAIERQAAIDSNWREVCRAVNARDGHRCRCCGVRTDPNVATRLERGHHHHVVYRSAGGPDTTANVCLLCAACHDAEHVKRSLHIEGNADVALSFARRDEAGQWYIWRQETGVRVYERD